MHVCCRRDFFQLTTAVLLIKQAVLSPERAVLVQFVQIGIDAAPFPLQEALHRVGKGRVRQSVGRPGLLRQEAARHLVFALGAAFEGGDALGDAELQRLVVGRLEMQTRHVLQRAPVAAV